MSRELGMTTAVMNFHKENIAKEAHYRLLARQREIEEGMTEEERMEKFNAAHQKRLARQREMIPKVEIPVLEKQIQKSDPVKLPALLRNGDNGQNKENVTVNLMKPVDASVRGQILNGISKEGLGKHAYLASRKMLAPQDKYNYQALSSWDYGWDVSDALKFHKPSPFARKMIVNQTFYRRNGVQNSPVEI